MVESVAEVVARRTRALIGAHVVDTYSPRPLPAVVIVIVVELTLIDVYIHCEKRIGFDSREEKLVVRRRFYWTHRSVLGLGGDFCGEL